MFLLFKLDTIVMKILEATTQLVGFTQSLPMRKYNNIFSYRGPHWNKDGAIDTFLYSVKSHNGTTAVELIFGTKTLLTNFYAVGSKLGLNIAKFLQDRFRDRGIPINIWYDNAQE